MTLYGDREKCYRCYRPKSSCMCPHVQMVDTKTQFIILMHPKEFKKTKNNTGRFTHLSLNNSKLFIGDDFTNHKQVNEIIETTNSYILYPSKESINISNEPLDVGKDISIFLIDSTWACSVALLARSKNLQKLQHISFDTTRLSEYKIKKQPAEYCLSTIESTLCVLELLNKHNIENISTKSLDNFLNPFREMVKYQYSILEDNSKPKRK